MRQSGKLIFIKIALMCFALCFSASALRAQSPAPAPVRSTGAASASEILTLTGAVLLTCKEQSERASKHLDGFMSVVAVIAAILAFFGFREIYSIRKLYKGKLEALQQEYENKQSLQIAEFQEKSNNNARALVASQLTWNLIKQANELRQGTDDARRTELFQTVVDHVNKALPTDFEKKLDPYLSGLLLIRKAFALKRMGDFHGALNAALAALKADGDGSRAEWAFNAACYAALGKRIKECCDLLALAIRLDPVNRQDAHTETDFDQVRKEPDFIAIVGAV